MKIIVLLLFFLPLSLGRYQNSQPVNTVPAPDTLQIKIDSLLLEMLEQNTKVDSAINQLLKPDTLILKSFYYE